MTALSIKKQLVQMRVYLLRLLNSKLLTNFPQRNILNPLLKSRVLELELVSVELDGIADLLVVQGFGAEAIGSRDGFSKDLFWRLLPKAEEEFRC